MSHISDSKVKGPFTSDSDGSQPDIAYNLLTFFVSMSTGAGQGLHLTLNIEQEEHMAGVLGGEGAMVTE